LSASRARSSPLRSEGDRTSEGGATFFVATDDATAVRRVPDAIAKLGTELDSTAVVDAIIGSCLFALDKAFGHRRTHTRGVWGNDDAPWWSTECAEARAAMLA
jgi:hypothetical protein